MLLADADGEREVALADYFTGYRQSVRRPDELIRAIRIPLPLAPLVAFHKIAKRRFDDISSVAVGYAIELDGAVVRTARIGLGGVAATPIRARETEAALEGRPWSRRDRARGRCSCCEARAPRSTITGPARRIRIEMLGQSLRKLYADGREAWDLSALSERPEQPTVGLTIPHESAALHVTGDALYTDDLVLRTKDVLHAYPVQVMHARARITALRTEPALQVPGVVRVLTAADVPGVNDAGVKHDEPLFPDEVMFFGHAVCWVLGETLEAARLGAAAVEVEVGAAALVRHGPRGDRRRAPSRARSRRSSAVTSKPRCENSVHVFSGEFEFSGQEHFYLETHAALAMVDETGQIFVQSSTQHPSETQEIVAHVLGRHSHEVTVQCLRMGGGFGGKEMQPHGFAAIAALGATLTGRPVRLRLNRTQDLTMSGKRHGFHADWRVGFDADGRLQALDATLTADGGWSLDLSEPVLARALCHIDNAYWIPNIRVNGRIAKTNKTSQHRVPRASAARRACS